MEIFEKANQLNLERKYDEADKVYDLLLAQNPKNPHLLATVGTMYIRMGRYGMAISLLERATETEKQSDMYFNLGIAYKFAGLYDKARKYFDRSIEGTPSADALANYAGLYLNVGTPEIGMIYAKRALELEPNLPMAHWNMALAYLELGQWEQGWKEQEWGFDVGLRVDRKPGQFPRWDGTKGKTVIVYGEQGLGDEIMFASMIPDLMKTNTVILECHKRLETLFHKSFGIECHGTREDTNIPWIADTKAEYQISIGSLGRFFRNKREDYPGTPYLKAEPLEKTKFRVGISWTGGLKQGRVRTREVPLNLWKTILDNHANCEFVNLQYTDCKEDLSFLRSIGYDVKYFPEVHAEDYYETAKLVKSCDLVISVCTSVIHLAGALGVPCWVMVPNKPAWRYGITGGMPWYRSVRLYRQPKDADWSGVTSRVGYDLEELVRCKNEVCV